MALGLLHCDLNRAVGGARTLRGFLQNGVCSSLQNKCVNDCFYGWFLVVFDYNRNVTITKFMNAVHKVCSSDLMLGMALPRNLRDEY